MKIKRIFPLVAGLLMAVGMSLTLTSCESDDYWYDGPGWNDGFYDSDLNGYWQLVQVNSVEVNGTDRNFLFFNGRGYGQYYFWENGRRYVDDTYYDCQYSNSGISDYQLNIQYGNSRPTTMNYWFTHGGNTLWLQWRDNGRPTTYVYDRYGGAPW